VDTWWQTETGSIMLTTLPGTHAMKPGSAGLPMFGVEPAIVNHDGHELGPDEGGLLVLKRPWPSMLRTVYGDDERYRRSYWGEIEGVYFAGDGARRDVDGYVTVVGRIDDVLNVSGHRLGTMEVESALVAHPAVAEAAVVGRPDDVKGECIVAFVLLQAGATCNPEELRAHVVREIGAIARPDEILIIDALPKTRSGKIMRRVLRQIAAGEEIRGDTSTLEDPGVVDRLRIEASR
jgi:acetyl-CoA synthetase